jgi:hypothetical protein
MSFIESLVNMVLGYVVAVTAQVFIFPLFGIFVPLYANMQIGAAFMAISLVRQYLFRRLFNRQR